MERWAGKMYARNNVAWAIDWRTGEVIKAPGSLPLEIVHAQNQANLEKALSANNALYVKLSTR